MDRDTGQYVTTVLDVVALLLVAGGLFFAVHRLLDPVGAGMAALAPAGLLIAAVSWWWQARRAGGDGR